MFKSNIFHFKIDSFIINDTCSSDIKSTKDEFMDLLQNKSTEKFQKSLQFWNRNDKKYKKRNKYNKNIDPFKNLKKCFNDRFYASQKGNIQN